MRKLFLVSVLVVAVVTAIFASLPLSAQIRDVPMTPGLIAPVATAELRGNPFVSFQWQEPAVEQNVTKFKLNVTNDFGGVPGWSAKLKASKVCSAGACEADTSALPGDAIHKFIAGQYTWNLVAINADGKSIPATRMFQLFPLDEPTLVAPLQNATVVDDATLNINFTYNGADDPVKVKIKVVDDKGRLDHSATLPYGTCSGGDCSYVTPPLKNDGYKLTVKLINRLKSRKMQADFTMNVPAR